MFKTCGPFSKGYLRTIHIHWHYILHILQQGAHFCSCNGISHILILWTLYSRGSAHIQYLLPILKIISHPHSHILRSFCAHFTAGHTLLLFQLYMSNVQNSGYYIQEGQPTFNTWCPFTNSYLMTICIHWNYFLHILQQDAHIFPSN